jgi:hypothetical protein
VQQFIYRPLLWQSCVQFRLWQFWQFPREHVPDTLIIAACFADIAAGKVRVWPRLLQSSFMEKPVQEGIRSALDDFLIDRTASGLGMNDLTGKDGNDIVKAIYSSGRGKFQASVLKQVKDTASYARLERAVADFQNSAKISPMGVWVNKNRTMVFVAGLMLVVGGAVALYVTKTGGPVNNLIVDQITHNRVDVLKVGKFSLRGQLLAFQSDKQKIGGALIATERFEQVNISLNVGVIATTSSVQQVNGHTVLTTQPLILEPSATVTSTKTTTKLGVSVGFHNGPLKSLNIGVGAVFTDNKVSSENLHASVRTTHGDFALKVQEFNKQYEGIAVWTVHF